MASRKRVAAVASAVLLLVAGVTLFVGASHEVSRTRDAAEATRNRDTPRTKRIESTRAGEAGESNGREPKTKRVRGTAPNRHDGRTTSHHDDASADLSRTDTAPSATEPPPVLEGDVRPTLKIRRSEWSRSMSSARHETTGPLRVEVRLFAMEDSAPLRSATVEVYRQDDAFVAPTVVYTGQTSGEGRVVFAHPGAGAVVVRVNARGRVPLVDDSIRVPSKRSLVIEGHLRVGSIVKGTLEHFEDGTPVSGGEVLVLADADDGRVRPYYESEITQRCPIDDEGHFQFDAARFDHRVWLEARSPGWATRTLSIESAATGETTALEVMGSAASAHGVVHRPDGSPARRATVIFVSSEELYEWQPDDLDRTSWFVERVFDRDQPIDYECLHVFTDDHGRFRADDFRDGATYDVVAFAEDFGCSTVRSGIDMSAEADRDVGKLQLRVFGRVELTIVGDDGQPVGGVEADVAGRSRYTADDAGSGGQILFRQVDPITLRGEIEAPDGRQATFSVDVHPGRTSKERIVLQAGATCLGRVVDQDGSGVSDVRVWVKGAGTVWDRNDARVVTGSDGRFEAKGLPPGKYDAWIEKDGFSMLETEEFSVPGPERTFVLLPGITIRARLIPSDGARVPEHCTTYYERGFADHPDAYWHMHEIEQVDEHRAVESVDLPFHGGRVGLNLSPYRGVISKTIPTRGDVVDFGDVQLVDPYLVQVHVTTDDKRPAAGADIHVVSPAIASSRIGWNAKTDDEGRITIPVEIDGVSFIRISLDGYVSTSVPVVLGAEDVVDLPITLYSGIVVSGRAVNARGEPAADTRVHVRPTRRNRSGPTDVIGIAGYAQTDATGRFEIRVLPGLHEIPTKLWSIGEYETYDEVDIREGTELLIRFRNTD